MTLRRPNLIWAKYSHRVNEFMRFILQEYLKKGTLNGGQK